MAIVGGRGSGREPLLQAGGRHAHPRRGHGAAPGAGRADDRGRPGPADGRSPSGRTSTSSGGLLGMTPEEVGEQARPTSSSSPGSRPILDRYLGAAPPAGPPEAGVVDLDGAPTRGPSRSSRCWSWASATSGSSAGRAWTAMREDGVTFLLSSDSLRAVPPVLRPRDPARRGRDRGADVGARGDRPAASVPQGGSRAGARGRGRGRRR